MNEALHSELEYLILAMAAEGIKSGYSMRVQMNRMDGLRWSAESGSVYRVLKRLTAAGHLAELGKAGVPNRERTEYEVTPSGLQVLRSWVTSDLTGDELRMLVDPVRIRARYFGEVPLEAQRSAIERWLKQNAKYMRQLTKRLGKPVTAQGRAEANVLALAKARQAWLKSMLTSLADG